MVENSGIIFAVGLISGLLSGLLGIGGGVIIVPLLGSLAYSYDNAVATSSLAIVLTSISGSFQNWRMGYLDFKRIILLGLPAILTAWLGAFLVPQMPDYFKYAAFGTMLLTTIFLFSWRKRLISLGPEHQEKKINPTLARIGTGGSAGLLAGLFGVGGGVIMVPLQMLLLGEKIKVAIQTSLGVIVITSISACIGHAQSGNILLLEGIILGIGGLIGTQFSTRFMPKFPDKVVNFCFRTLLAILAGYFFWKAWMSY